MQQDRNTEHPLHFFILVLIITWIPWLTAIATQSSLDSTLGKILVFSGGIGPTLSALILIYRYKSRALQKDYWRRIFNLKLIDKQGYLFILLFFPIMASLAVFISTFFNGSFGQFQIVDEVRSNIILLVTFILFTFLFGPIPEELGWRGFWLDELRTKYNGLTASIIIGCTWAAWHVPLFFINGYPIQDMVGHHLKMFVFFADLLPKAIIYTFVFYKNNRSTFSAILFHFMCNFTGTIIEIDPLTEFIQFILLTIVATTLIVTNKDIFFFKQTNMDLKQK